MRPNRTVGWGLGLLVSLLILPQTGIQQGHPSTTTAALQQQGAKMPNADGDAEGDTTGTTPVVIETAVPMQPAAPTPQPVYSSEPAPTAPPPPPPVGGGEDEP